MLGTKLIPLPATIVPIGRLLNLFRVLLCPVLLGIVFLGAAALVVLRVAPNRMPLVAAGLVAGLVAGLAAAAAAFGLAAAGLSTVFF